MRYQPRVRNTQVKVAADDLSELDPNVDSEGDEDEDESGEANSESDQNQEAQFFFEGQDHGSMVLKQGEPEDE